MCLHRQLTTKFINIFQKDYIFSYKTNTLGDFLKSTALYTVPNKDKTSTSFLLWHIYLYLKTQESNGYKKTPKKPSRHIHTKKLKLQSHYQHLPPQCHTKTKSTQKMKSFRNHKLTWHKRSLLVITKQEQISHRVPDQQRVARSTSLAQLPRKRKKQIIDNRRHRKNQRPKKKKKKQNIPTPEGEKYWALDCSA